MTNADYVYSKFVSPVLSTILCSKSGFSRRERVAVILRYAFGIREKQIPPQARQDWRSIKAVNSSTIPQHLLCMNISEARAHALSSTQSLRVLSSFWNVVNSVVQELAE
jgi:hypothetical protein